MKRILIVEDEPDIAEVLADDLRLEGHAADTVGTGEAALERAHDYDLLVLDVMLPRIDGFEVCRKLRRSGIAVPILLLTARSQEAEVVMGLDLGADEYVTKPFSPRELRARIRALLRRTDDPASEVMRFGDFVLDVGGFELRDPTGKVDLTPRELTLLAAFLRHRGQVLTRQQILDSVWGTDTYVTERVVDTHVGNLRKKIERDPGRPRFLVSVHGVGYRFEAAGEDVEAPSRETANHQTRA